MITKVILRGRLVIAVAVRSGFECNGILARGSSALQRDIGDLGSAPRKSSAS